VGDLAGVFGTNLFSAEGAAQAIKNANKQGTIKVASFDAPEQAIVDLRKWHYRSRDRSEASRLWVASP